MIKSREIAHIFLALVLFAFIISFLDGLNAYFYALLTAAIILFVSIAAKKIMAYHYEAETEQKPTESKTLNELFKSA